MHIYKTKLKDHFDFSNSILLPGDAVTLQNHIKETTH